MTPVVYLSDAFLANGSEPWQIPDARRPARHRGRRTATDTATFQPYARDPETLARPWAVPGHAGPRAPHRRPREGRHHRQRQLRPGQPPPDDDAARRRRSPASPTTSRTSQVFGPAERRPADPRLGLDLRRDPQRRRAAAGARAGRVAHAHLRHLNPFPRNTGDVLRSYRQVLVPEVNLGQLLAAHPGDVTWSTPSASTGSAASRSGSARSSEAAELMLELEADRPMTDAAIGPTTGRRQPDCRQLTRKDFVSDQEVRWCPGCGDYSILAQTQKVMPDFGVPDGEHRVHLAASAAPAGCPYYMNTYGFHTHPRPRADARDRAQGCAARPDGLGHHRRRRRAVDRRQPRPPLDAPQRRHQDGHVQQPHLRPDQGPGVADVGVRQEDQVDARWARSTRPIMPLSVALAAEATFVARSVDTHTEHLQETLERGRPPQRLGVRRGPPELQHLQRRRLARLHRPRRPRRPDARPRARQADDLRQGPRQGHPPPRPAPRGRRRSGRTASPRPTCSSTTTARTRTSRTSCRACSGPSSRCRSACSATSSGRPTTS